MVITNMKYAVWDMDSIRKIIYIIHSAQIFVSFTSTVGKVFLDLEKPENHTCGFLGGVLLTLKLYIT